MATKRRGHGEGTIYRIEDRTTEDGKVKKGRWVAMLTYYDGGKRKRKALYGKTRAEVRDKLTKALRDRQQGLPVSNDRLTTKEFLLRWLADAVEPRLRPSSVAAYAKHVHKYLIPKLGKVPLAQLAPQEVERMLNDLLRQGLSPRYVREIRGTLRTALNRALKWGLVARNAAMLVDPPGLRQHEIRPLDPDQAVRFLEAVRDDRLEALYTVALALGLRQGEALGLRWEDVDLDAGRVTVRFALQRVAGKLQLVEPKTEKSRRSLPLPAFAVDALRVHKIRQLQERLAAGPRWQETGFVFTTAIGTPLDARNVIRSFKHHLAQAGLPDIRFHDLRHSAATLLLAQGESLKDISELLGHSQISITADLYAHVLEASKRRMAGRMDALLGRAATPS